MDRGSGWHHPLENAASARNSVARWSCSPTARMAPLRSCLHTATASAGRCLWASSVLGLRLCGEGLIMAGDTPVEVGKVMITDAGRRAIEE